MGRQYQATAVEERVSLALLLATIFAAAWCTFIPYFGTIALAILACLPWISTVAISRSEGGGLNLRCKAGVAFAFIPPGLISLLRASTHAYISNWKRAWLFGIPLAALLCYAALRAEGKMRSPVIYKAMIFFFANFYSFGMVLESNMILDFSKPRPFKSIVLAEHIVEGRRNTYEIELSAWANKKTEWIAAPRKFYEKHPVGSQVCLISKEGALGLDWYALKPCE